MFLVPCTRSRLCAQWKRALSAANMSAVNLAKCLINVVKHAAEGASLGKLEVELLTQMKKVLIFVMENLVGIVNAFHLRLKLVTLSASVKLNRMHY